jgi:hypothetical protein
MAPPTLQWHWSLAVADAISADDQQQSRARMLHTLRIVAARNAVNNERYRAIGVKPCGNRLTAQHDVSIIQITNLS